MVTTNNIRFSSFNASLNRSNQGELIGDLSTPNNEQAKTVAEIIQQANPDVLLVNEFDFDENGEAAKLFQQNYLSQSQNGSAPIDYPYVYLAPSNTGIPSELDLDNNGEIGDPNDAFSFGFFPGQFGMVLYSKYPIDTENVRTFQNFIWQDMPGALLPDNPETPEPQDWYSPEELEVFRLSSKSHWDIPINVDGEIIHVLASHPTPPVFDGTEDRNGTRNHDEIRFWADYITPGQNSYIYDDSGNFGGLNAGESFVIMGDQNADPFDGDSTNNAILQLLDNPLVNTAVTPSSEGAVEAALVQGENNNIHQGNPAFDTADFGDTGFGPGNLRVDYVLPSQDLEISEAAVFWPTSDQPLFDLVGNFDPDVLPTGFPSSDHRLVYADVAVAAKSSDLNRQSVAEIEFLGEATFETGFSFAETEVGGISGITYDQFNQVYYALADDRSSVNNARFYTLDINLSDGNLEQGDVTFQDVTTLLDNQGNPFPESGIDPEGIALTSKGTLFISSEGDANNLLNPFVNQFSLAGEQFQELTVPDKFLPTADGSSGIRNNQAFESLTITPDERFLYTAVENALIQDGPRSSLESESAVRILQYDLTTGEPAKEFLYFTDTIPADSNPPGGFADNGLVELLAIDNTGTFLSLERSFASGVGNNLRLYETRLQGATDISNFDSLAIDPNNPDHGLFDVDAVAEKRLLLDFSDLGIPLDNSEAIAFGPTLADGRQSLIVTSDNNFNDSQITQFLAFGVELNTVPAITPTVETPPEIRFEDLRNNSEEASDPDDPAIYVHPTDSAKSFVIGTLKNAGLKVYDLNGQELQEIAPEGIRYNNVDLVYGFDLGGKSVDLAIASDRLNDTLAIFAIDPETRQLQDITAPNLQAEAFSVFGVDDGEQTAYGLATYTSPVDGKSYTFVTQADGAQIAQLELKDNGAGLVEANVVRTLDLPVPTGNPEDSQSEGIVIDRETGIGYVAAEEIGIFKFSAEPNGGDQLTLLQSGESDFLTTDIEGLSIYYASNGTGALIASSQGNSTYALFARDGSNEYLGSRTIAASPTIDGAEDTDGIDIINVPLGEEFPLGLLVVQDGSNESATVFQDPEDGEIQNFNANFKFVALEQSPAFFPDFLPLEPSSFDPRNPQPNSLINGIASGDTTQDSTVLWARSTFAGEVSFEYSTDAQFSTIAGIATATVTDINAPVKVEIEGLASGTEYYYRVTDAAGATEIGQFETSAELGTQTGLRFGVTGDWRGELNPYPAINNVPERNLAFLVEHGDTIYADIGSPAVLNPDGSRKSQVETLDEFRAKHSEVYGQRFFGENNWAEVRASTSILATIDDHEVTNDFAGGADVATDSRFTDAEGTLINDSSLYENGLQAFQEYNPLREEFYGETGDEVTAGERQLYRFNTYGSDAATFVLDTRSFRDAALTPPADLSDPNELGRVLTESLTLERTLLGEVQLNDLKQDLLSAQESGITWKFVMVPEPIQNLFPGIQTDSYEGYAQERTEILSFVNENEIDNVVFVAADVHATFVNNLTYQEEPFGDQIATSAFEITTGGVTFDSPTGFLLGNFFAGDDPEAQAFFNSLPITSDTDSIVNDKDDFVKQGINDLLLSPLGFDRLGLDDNLAIADGLIDANLIQGDYIAAFTYGWTEFDINQETQKLTVTTYGVDAYSEEELLADPAGILELTPTIVSQFEVNPSGFEMINGTDENDTLLGTAGSNRISGFGGNDTIAGELDDDVIFGGEGDDLLRGDANSRNSGGKIGGDDIIYGGEGKDRIGGKAGNDSLFGGEDDDLIWGDDGDDLLRGGKGNDTLTGDDFSGGSGSDIFILATGEGTDTIIDFQISEDSIGLADGLTFGQLSVTQEGNNTLISVNNDTLAILNSVETATLIDNAAKSFTLV